MKISKSLSISLQQNSKPQYQFYKRYRIPPPALHKQVKQCSTAKIDNGNLLITTQVKKLKIYNSNLAEKNLIPKSDYPIHTKLKQILDTFYTLHFDQQHSHCWVLNVSTSTYYKYLSTDSPLRIRENQHITFLLLHITRIHQTVKWL